MKVQWLWLLSASMIAGCFRAHGLPEEVRVSLSVMTQTGALPAVPAPAARVVVEDCETGARLEAVTGADGLAEFDATEGTCWNITAVIDGFARTVLRAPVPLPGPIVFPLTAPPVEGETVQWEVRFEGQPTGEDPNVNPYYLEATVGAGERDWSLPLDVVGGSAPRAALLAPNQAVVVASTSEGAVAGAALVSLSASETGAFTATVALPLDLLPPRTASVEVLLRAGGVYNMVNPRYGMDSHVYALSPAGNEYQIGPRTDPVGDVTTSPVGLEVRKDYTWFDLPGAESWTPAMSGRGIAAFQREDPCSLRTVSWGRIRLVDGVTHRTEVPTVTTRQVSGTSLDTLSVDYGGEGHRSFLALRTSGEQPFEWTIEPFETGVTSFQGLPPLPDGVAETVGLMERSIYVRFGVTAPSAASFSPSAPEEMTVPWLIHEGFVIGQVSDFGPSVSDCMQVP